MATNVKAITHISLPFEFLYQRSVRACESFGSVFGQRDEVDTVRSAGSCSLGVSWGPGRIDLVGADSKGDVWHKFYGASSGWEPNSGPGSLEIFTGANADSPVSVTSWGIDRLNYVFIDTDRKVRHKYWTGSEWAPSGSNFEDLGEGPTGKLSFNSWGQGRLDIAGRSEDGECLHKAWTGSSWHPEVTEWENFGGNFTSEPVLLSLQPGRLDIFGITNEGNVSHKDGTNWNPEGKEWEDLGGKGFSGSLTVSSPSSVRMDVWAVGDEDGALYHLFWEPFSATWTGWESLGGQNFTNAPAVVHWGPNRIDILGRESSEGGQYAYKYWDGYSWSDWEYKVGKFVSEPTLVSITENNLNLFGIDADGKVLLQVWDGSTWLPSSVAWYRLGDTNVQSNSESLRTQKATSRFFESEGNEDSKFELKV